MGQGTDPLHGEGQRDTEAPSLVLIPSLSYRRPSLSPQCLLQSDRNSLWLSSPSVSPAAGWGQLPPKPACQGMEACKSFQLVEP